MFVCVHANVCVHVYIRVCVCACVPPRPEKLQQRRR